MVHFFPLASDLGLSDLSLFWPSLYLQSHVTSCWHFVRQLHLTDNSPAVAHDLFTSCILDLPLLVDELFLVSLQNLSEMFPHPINLPHQPHHPKRQPLLWHLWELLLFKTSIICSGILCQTLVGTRSLGVTSPWEAHTKTRFVLRLLQRSIYRLPDGLSVSLAWLTW